MTIEDRLMLEIIHTNHKKQKELNRKRENYYRKYKKINNILMFFGSVIFFYGLMILINIIENAKF